MFYDWQNYQRNETGNSSINLISKELHKFKIWTCITACDKNRRSLFLTKSSLKLGRVSRQKLTVETRIKNT